MFLHSSRSLIFATAAQGAWLWRRTEQLNTCILIELHIFAFFLKSWCLRHIQSNNTTYFESTDIYICVEKDKICVSGERKWDEVKGKIAN